tara:strand:- start:715 stop:1050 length:336 start_codon:yes stop_codon:yes gene_type:complete
MSITRDVWIQINILELVASRARFLEEELSPHDMQLLSNDLRLSLTFDTLYQMVDESILEYVGKSDKHYGEIQPEPGREAWLNEIEKNRKCFEMVDLVSPSWTIKVPRRIKG